MKIGHMAGILVFLCVLSAGARPKAIVIGASSGIGQALSKKLASSGYDVGLLARRLDRLIELKNEIMDKYPSAACYAKVLDVTDRTSMEQLREFIQEIGGCDLVVISISACASSADKTQFESDCALLGTDLLGFWKMAHVGFEFFKRQGHGHLVGLSSIDRLRGNPDCPVYSAAKAFVGRYLEGMRNQLHKDGFEKIFVTDIVPGYVQTEGFDAASVPGAYWVSAVDDAAGQIFDAIVRRQKTAYISRRWLLIGLLMQILPDWLLYDVIGGL